MKANTVSVKITLEGADIVSFEQTLNENADVLTGLTLTVCGSNLKDRIRARPADTDCSWQPSCPIIVPQSGK